MTLIVSDANIFIDIEVGNLIQVMFQLPEIFGGYLELVREIVEITINMMKDAGQDIHNANEKLIKGDEKFAAGEYKKAYKEYGKSYREATK